MTPLHRIEGCAIAFDRPDVDTDQLIPARFIMKPRDCDYGPLLFHDLRVGPRAEPDFPLDLAEHRGATILITGENFGCGSAREQAVWALQGYGIRALVGPSFGGIFHANCIKNGLLPATVPADVAAGLCRALRESPNALLTLDLQARTLLDPQGHAIAFSIADADRAQLLSGKDDITLTLGHEAQIEAFEQARQSSATWTRRSLADALTNGGQGSVVKDLP